MTPTDLQVLRAIATGKTAKEAAYALNLSEHAVEYHLLAARKSLGAKNTIEAVSKYLQRKPEKRKSEGRRSYIQASKLFPDAAKPVG